MEREGLITREEALIRLKDENKLHMNEIQKLLDSTGITDISYLKKDKEEIIQKELLAE